jgi:PAT family beta-lactamase induction signal transducer AmpG
MTASPALAPEKKHNLLQTLRRPGVLAMLLLGFSSGLPFLLTAGTFGYWLRDEGTSLKAIGFLSWVGFAYSFKFLWSPLIDRLDAPLVGRWLGRRRGWMLISQLIIAAGLVAMALITPKPGLTSIGIAALVVAFASATQDIVIDAWRIETAQNNDELGVLTSNYQLGYRIAVIVSDALILVFANHLGWPVSYDIMAALMAVGIVATLRAKEPEQADRALEARAAEAPLWTPRGFVDAVLGPFIAFFRTYGPLALLMLLFITLYRVPEYVIGPMVTPFYHDLGLSKDVVGAVRGSVGSLPVADHRGRAAGPGRSLLRPDGGLWRRSAPVRDDHGVRQFRRHRRRGSADLVHVELDQPGLHRQPIRPAVVDLFAGWQVPQGLLGIAGGVAAEHWPPLNGVLRPVLRRRGAGGNTVDPAVPAAGGGGEAPRR